MPRPEPRRWDALFALNYYAPYVSGLTDTARLVAEGLAARGRRIAVVAGRHDTSLPPQETLNGVDVHRTTVVARIGKGLVSPAFVTTVAKLARQAEVVNLHLPMLEAGPLAAWVGRHAPVVSTYHCDVTLPASPVNKAMTRAVDASTRLALRRSVSVCWTSLDYARQSRVWDASPPSPRVIPPPCIDRSGGTPSFRETTGMHVGFLGRIVEEKGTEHLVEAFRRIPDKDARLLIGGDFERVAGGSVIDRVRAAVADDPRVRLLGFVPEERLADFYASLDVFCLPSVNSLEAFGIVQVEALLAGVPVVASDLPGVRVPVQTTSAGVLVPAADPEALAAAVANAVGLEVDVAGVRRLYGVDATVTAYDDMFREARERART